MPKPKLPPNFKMHPIYPESWKPEVPGEMLEGDIFQVGERPIGDKIVPYMEVITEEGTVIQVLCGTAAFRRLYESGLLQPDYYVMIQYQGESKTIQKANNFMKLFEYAVFDQSGKQLFLDENVPEELLDLSEEEKSKESQYKMQLSATENARKKAKAK